MLRRLRRVALGILIPSLTLLAVSGRWQDPWLWTFVAIWAAAVSYGLLIIDDDLVKERFRPPTRGADASALRIIRLLAVGQLIVGALDVGHWRLTAVPSWLRVVGLIGMAAGFALVFRSMAANRFFSVVVRIQDDRGHTVVDRGPYAVIRHPGYAGMITSVPLSAMAIGSWIGVMLAVLYSALIFRRVFFEDAFLRSNLAGYADYARRVPYRLVPGLW
jgi:protein-S-isoprenylcysteine O-methyltransferase Ste14